MGRILQRTAISTNIKERLDFSCALFGPDGGLVSNAPHIPVHLGAMQETVQFQVRGPCPATVTPFVLLQLQHPWVLPLPWGTPLSPPMAPVSCVPALSREPHLASHSCNVPGSFPCSRGSLSAPSQLHHPWVPLLPFMGSWLVWAQPLHLYSPRSVSDPAPGC